MFPWFFSFSCFFHYDPLKQCLSACGKRSVWNPFQKQGTGKSAARCIRRALHEKHHRMSANQRFQSLLLQVFWGSVYSQKCDHILLKCKNMPNMVSSCFIRKRISSAPAKAGPIRAFLPGNHHPGAKCKPIWLLSWQFSILSSICLAMYLAIGRLKKLQYRNNLYVLRVPIVKPYFIFKSINLPYLCLSPYVCELAVHPFTPKLVKIYLSWISWIDVVAARGSAPIRSCSSFIKSSPPISSPLM